MLQKLSNRTMKTTLTIDQSAELIKRGVSEKRATSSVWSPSENAYIHPTFTLADLLSLLPKEIENGLYSLDLMADNVEWDSVYSSAHVGYDPYFVANEKELIDVLYKTLLWTIDHNHVKLD